MYVTIYFAVFTPQRLLYKLNFKLKIYIYEYVDRTSHVCSKEPVILQQALLKQIKNLFYFFFFFSPLHKQYA